MKVIPKLQQGNTIESDNTKVVRPEIHEPIKAKPRQYSIVDLGGEPSNDTRSAAERNRDYWHPIKEARDRFKASMSNETNPLVGIERTILPSAAGAALVTTPAAVVGGALGNMTVDKLTGGWGNWLEDKTGIPSEIGVYTNPGAWYGGAKGYKIGKDKLITKSIKGDADLAWNPINKNHWIFNKEARTPSNIAMATANRITPFLSKVEKLPLKVAAYKAAKRTNGNASVSLQDIKTMPADYTGSSILGGGNLEGRNLLAKYIFDENPVVKRMFFNKATSNIKPISRNEARRGFSHGDRYEQLYPGIYNRRYEMSAVVPSGRPLKFQEASEFTEYAGKNPIGKIIGKEAEPVMRMGDKEFMTFRQPGTDYIGPIDDVAGHLVKFQMNKGKLRQTSQDMWKFNPADYAKRWNDSPNTANQVRLIKQAALMDKVGRPFILQQSNPIWIEGSSVRNPELVTMAHGGRFDFKKSPLLKKQEEINGKRDMRKKFIKSSRPTYKKRIKKAQQGMKFVSYNPVSNPTIDYTDITNPINPFSEYNYNTTYDKPEALVVPVRDTDETDVVANNPTVEPVINKPVASKPVTANSTWKSPYTNRKQWSTELINAYKKAGITNDNAIRMLLAQDALESSWGKSAQGKYNFGNLTTGSSWKGDYVTGNDKNAKGEAIKQKFRSYNSMDEYAADKIQFLKRLYDFDENDDINKFVAKLTGSNKGKRRYAEATNYAKVLTGVYNGIPKGENGMIIKYQNPPHGIARRDAIKDYRPEIPFSPIKQPVKPYMPTQQPILSPDNRTGWEKEVSRQIKADRAKNDNLYGNQHTWNWSAPFTNARITKDNASAMFDFDKSAAMSTFAIGQGIASPVTTATSIAGSLVGAGIGNKVAGEKGALVGGFVGGMVNPKFGMRFNKKNGFRGDAASARNATTTPRFNISKESLPDYAKPNWQGDQFALLKERLANGGFDRLERVSGGKAQTDKLIQTAIKMGMSPRELNPYANDFSPAFRQKILSSEPRYGTAESFKVAPHLGGFSDRRGDYYAITTEHIAKHTPSVVSSTKAHELAHYTYNPHEVPPMSVYKLPNDNPSRNYLMGFGTKEDGTELTARGTQIKNYFGLKEGDPITEDMLKYAADNYVKDTGYDNNMTDFFKGIIDYKEMAKWLTERSPLLILPTLNTKNYENGNNNK